MADVKLEDLYLPKDELKDVMQLVAKKGSIKNYTNKSSNRVYKNLRNNLKIREE